MEQEGNQSHYRSAAGSVKRGIACHSHVERSDATDSAQCQHEAQPEPWRIALIFFAFQGRNLLLQVRFLVQQIFQRIGFAFQRLPFFLGQERFAVGRLFFQHFHFRFPLLPEMKFIISDAQTFGKTASFLPVYIGARRIQAKRPIPQG